MGSAIIGLALSLRNYWDTWAERTLTRKKRQQCLKARSRDGWHCGRKAPKVNERFIPANSQISLAWCLVRIEEILDLLRKCDRSR